MAANLLQDVGIINKRYEIVSPLGQGGMGTVYIAKDRLTGKRVAIKRVSKAFSKHNPFFSAGDPTNARLALAHEFKMLATLRHPHIISVLDYGFDDDRLPYIAMDLLEAAETLVGAGRSKSLRTKIQYMLQLLQALVYLHRRRILHCDLKPGNVLVSDGHVKVLDFGLAKLHDPLRSRVEGTLAYMAPETLSDGKNSVESDLYAVGVMGFEMLTGHHPHRMEKDLIRQILNEMPDFGILQDYVTEHPHLTVVLQRLLEKDPMNRYQSAAIVVNEINYALGHTVEYDEAALRESFLQSAAFVGRQVELTALLEALQKAIQRVGSSWLIGGESGVGKSRLTEELRIWGLVEGVVVVRGQTMQSGAAPYAVWREVLRGICVYGEIQPDEARILKPLVSDISDLVGYAVEDAPEIDPKQNQARLHQTLMDILRRFERPLLVILEDLQWAGEESLQLLAYLAPQLLSTRVMMVATYRDDERPRLPHDHPHMNLLMLRRLNEGEISELSELIMGKLDDPLPVVEFITKETEGNIFFIVEVIRALAEEAGGLDLVGRMTLPQSVFKGQIEQLITRRLAQVPDDARELLYVAAIFGKQLNLEVLGALDKSRDLEKWLADCAEVNVLKVDENGWAFAHDKFREGLLKQLAADELRRRNHAIAETLETLYPNIPDYYAKLAHHWQGNPEKEAHYNRLAGQTALERGAFSEATHYLRMALDFFRAQAAVAQQIEILYRLGEGCMYQGMFADANLYLGEGLALARRESHTAFLIGLLTMQGSVYFRSGNFAGATAFLEEALHLAEGADETNHVATILLWLGAMAIVQGRGEEADRHLERGLQLARTLNEKGFLVARILNAMGERASRRGDFAQAIAIYEESEAILNLYHHQHARVGILLNKAHAMAPLYETAVVRAEYVKVLTMALRLHDRMIALGTLSVLAESMASIQGEAAFELLSFVYTDQAFSQEMRTLFQKVYDEVRGSLNVAQIESIEARAKNHTLESISRTFFEVGPETTGPTIAEAKSPMNEG